VISYLPRLASRNAAGGDPSLTSHGPESIRRAASQVYFDRYFRKIADTYTDEQICGKRYAAIPDPGFPTAGLLICSLAHLLPCLASTGIASRNGAAPAANSAW